MVKKWVTKGTLARSSQKGKKLTSIIDFNGECTLPTNTLRMKNTHVNLDDNSLILPRKK